MESITQIKNKWAELSARLDKLIYEESIENAIQQLDEFNNIYADDQRKGVCQILNTIKNRTAKLQDEQCRLVKMLDYERKVNGYLYIGGIDEAGRGPLAGPVVAACVVLDHSKPIPFVNDSKKLSEKQRDLLYELIKKEAIAYGIGVVSEDDIDEINILQATYKAMRIAIESCNPKPDYLLNDAVIIPKVDMPQEKIIQGDAKSLSIAAASILAKVTRDQLMVAYDDLYPEYGFKSNKGYGAPIHLEALKKFGPSPIHRRSFIKNLI